MYVISPGLWQSQHHTQIFLCVYFSFFSPLKCDLFTASVLYRQESGGGNEYFVLLLLLLKEKHVKTASFKIIK